MKVLILSFFEPQERKACQYYGRAPRPPLLKNIVPSLFEAAHGGQVGMMKTGCFLTNLPNCWLISTFWSLYVVVFNRVYFFIYSSLKKPKASTETVKIKRKCSPTRNWACTTLRPDWYRNSTATLKTSKPKQPRLAKTGKAVEGQLTVLLQPVTGAEAAYNKSHVDEKVAALVSLWALLKSILYVW